MDALLRVQGGDESLIESIKANRQFQKYLAEHDPEHPLRAVGEYAEKRRRAESSEGGEGEAGERSQQRGQEHSDGGHGGHVDEEASLVRSHKKRMLELECREASVKAEAAVAQAEAVKAQAEAVKAQAEAAQAQANATKAQAEAAQAQAEAAATEAKLKVEAEERRIRDHEEARKQQHEAQLREADAKAEAALQEKQATEEKRLLGNCQVWLEVDHAHPRAVEPSPADRLAMTDVFRTASCPRGASPAPPPLGAALCLEAFLRKKGVKNPHEYRSSFGKAVRAEWNQHFRGQEQQQAAPPPKKNIFVNGQELPVNVYYEVHLPIIEAAYLNWRGNNDKKSTPMKSSGGVKRATTPPPKYPTLDGFLGPARPSKTSLVARLLVLAAS